MPVILTVHELKRLARNAVELMTLSADLQDGGIQLELLTGPLTGPYDPNGMGAMFFAVLAVAGQIERNYIREKTLEGQAIAASRGNHGGRPKVIDDDMLTFAVALTSRWQIVATSAPGDRYDQPEPEPVLGDKPEAPQATAKAGSPEHLEAALVAAVLAADPGEIAAVDLYSRRPEPPAIRYGATLDCHDGSKIYINRDQ
jgi:hypothetical protein